MFLSPKKKKEANLDDVYNYSGLPPNVSKEEIRKCRVSFKGFDSEGTDSLSLWEIRLALESTGLYPNENNIKEFIKTIDSIHFKNGKIDFPGFVNIYVKQKEFEQTTRDPAELYQAFHALGGGLDGSGKISVLTLSRVLRDDYLTPFKLDDVVDQLETDEKEITFQQFCVLFG